MTIPETRTGAESVSAFGGQKEPITIFQKVFWAFVLLGGGAFLVAIIVFGIVEGTASPHQRTVAHKAKAKVAECKRLGNVSFHRFEKCLVWDIEGDGIDFTHRHLPEAMRYSKGDEPITVILLGDFHRERFGLPFDHVGHREYRDVFVVQFRSLSDDGTAVGSYMITNRYSREGDENVIDDIPSRKLEEWISFLPTRTESEELGTLSLHVEIHDYLTVGLERKLFQILDGNGWGIVRNQQKADAVLDVTVDHASGMTPTNLGNMKTFTYTAQLNLRKRVGGNRFRSLVEISARGSTPNTFNLGSAQSQAFESLLDNVDEQIPKILDALKNVHAK